MRSLSVALALAVGAFASVASAQDPQRLPPSKTVDTVNAVTVRNQRKVPVTVYLEYGRFDRRLGMVPAGSTQTLRLPPTAYSGLERVRFLVHPEGEVTDLASQEFSVPRAAQLSLDVPPWGDMEAAPSDTMMQVIAPEELAETTITVDNPREVPVTVLVRYGKFDARLGQVAARARTTLRFPKASVGARNLVSIVVHPEGGRDLASETLAIRKGQHLGLRVPAR
jgi:hypothetical protein